MLVIHIAAGSVALLTALVALVTAKGGVMHVRAGRVYAIGMTLIFLTAVPLAVLGADVFLLLIAFFSFYLVFAGWRFARNRSRRPQPVDWVAVAILGLTGLAMWGYAVALALGGDGQWVTMLVFGGIAVALSVADGLFFRQGLRRERRPAPYLRVQRHLTNMMAGTIATVTAVMVVNVSLNPVWLPWILPTIVITPLIVWWNVRTARQARQARRPASADRVMQ
ncbi:MAG: hypothetical protein F4W95_04305 [Chloroflexi bacterium]|nr:hypothetical protein [Chloroflexota bacterium]MYD47694.1 hypothetical protein [Chloroflexota bacterium]